MINAVDGTRSWEQGGQQPLWAAAAVRESFRPAEILNRWLEENEDATRAERSDAMRATLELRALCVPGADARGTEAFRLATDVRLKLLEDLGVAQCRDAIGAIPQHELTDVERNLRTLLQGMRPEVNLDERAGLESLVQATLWARAAGAEVPDDPETLGRRLRQLAFLETLGGRDLSRFVGREKVRNRLTKLWQPEVSGARRMLIEGPGGIGKSLTLARFLADLLENEPPNRQPHAVFLIDFDQLSLRSARPATILLHLVQQAGRWSHRERSDELAELAQTVMSGAGGLDAVGESARGGESDNVNLDVAGRLARIVAGGDDPCRLIVFVDSFEQVDGFDEVAAGSPGLVLDMFERHGASVLGIFASRAFSNPRALRARERVRLKEFTVKEADEYVGAQARRAGLTVERSISRGVQKAVGRSPLALRLAVSLIEKSDGRLDLESWPQQADKSPENVQAALYDRILRRVRDKELRKLASPGLLVRRLTPGVITEVLARPCGLDLTKRSAVELMEAARREGQLFARDSADRQALRHRQDVRATMLANLERRAGPGMVREINQNAVAYYARQPEELVNLTEELYHRLRLNQPPEVLDDCWRPEAGELLRSALNELPLEAQAYARKRLGAASRGPASPRASGGTRGKRAQPPEPNLEEFRQMVRKQMQSGEPPPELLGRFEAEGRGLVSPLGDLYAEALFRAGRFEELMSGLEGLLAAPRSIEPRIITGVLAVCAGMLEGTGDAGAAQNLWAQALQHAGNETDWQRVLGCLVGSVRTRRKIGDQGDKRREEFERSLAIVEQHVSEISTHRVLARESVAELGEALGDASRRELPGLRDLLVFLGEANEAFPSAVNNDARVAEVSMRLFRSAGRTSLRELNGQFLKFAYGGPDNIGRIVEVLREEVDWTLEQAARRQRLSPPERRR